MRPGQETQAALTWATRVFSMVRPRGKWRQILFGERGWSHQKRVTKPAVVSCLNPRLLARLECSLGESALMSGTAPTVIRVVTLVSRDLAGCGPSNVPRREHWLGRCLTVASMESITAAIHLATVCRSGQWLPSFHGLPPLRRHIPTPLGTGSSSSRPPRAPAPAPSASAPPPPHRSAPLLLTCPRSG